MHQTQQKGAGEYSLIFSKIQTHRTTTTTSQQQQQQQQQTNDKQTNSKQTANKQQTNNKQTTTTTPPPPHDSMHQKNRSSELFRNCSPIIEISLHQSLDKKQKRKLCLTVVGKNAFITPHIPATMHHKVNFSIGKITTTTTTTTTKTTTTTTTATTTTTKFHHTKK